MHLLTNKEHILYFYGSGCRICSYEMARKLKKTKNKREKSLNKSDLYHKYHESHVRGSHVGSIFSFSQEPVSPKVTGEKSLQLQQDREKHNGLCSDD